MGHSWAKVMRYSPWFWWILGVFHTFWEFEIFPSKHVKNGSFLAILEQKAWAIAHGFDGFWMFFTPFGNLEILSKMSKMGHFWAKSMGYSPWFWWILGVFHTFWKIWIIYEQKAFKMSHFWPFLSKKHGL